MMVEDRVNDLLKETDEINEKCKEDKQRLEFINDNLKYNNKVYSLLLDDFQAPEEINVIENFIISNRKMINKNIELMDELSRETSRKIDKINNTLNEIEKGGVK